MGNAFCEIVPIDMICHRVEPKEIEKERSLICLKHYNSQFFDKRLKKKPGMKLLTHKNKAVSAEMKVNYNNLAVSMPESHGFDSNSRSPYSLNNKKIYND